MSTFSNSQWVNWQADARQRALDVAGDSLPFENLITRAVQAALDHVRAQVETSHPSTLVEEVYSILKAANVANVATPPFSYNPLVIEEANAVVTELQDLRDRVAAREVDPAWDSTQQSINEALRRELNEIRGALVTEFGLTHHDETIPTTELVASAGKRLRKEEQRLRTIRDQARAALPTCPPGIRPAEKEVAKLIDFAIKLENDRNVQSRLVWGRIQDEYPHHQGVPFATMAQRMIDDLKDAREELRPLREQVEELSTDRSMVRKEIAAAIPDHVRDHQDFISMVRTLVMHYKRAINKNNIPQRVGDAKGVTASYNALRLQLSRLGVNMGDGSTLLALVYALESEVKKLVQQRNAAEPLRTAATEALRQLTAVLVKD